MPRVTCVHATPRAIGPTSESFRAWAPEFEVLSVLEKRLFALDPRSEEALETFIKVLRHAENERPDVILTTCSMYTQHLPAARPRLRTPVLGIDEPMIERAAEIGGNLALVGSLPNAVESTARLIRERAAAGTREGHGPKVKLIETILVEPDACETPDGTRALADRLRGAAGRFDAVVVVQASLSPAAARLSAQEQERVLTGPPLAMARLREMVSSVDKECRP